MKHSIIVSGIVLAFAGQMASAGVLFFDDFNSENGGIGTLNYTGFANWSVSNGSVDLIGTGFVDFYPGNGFYVDLDGSSANAGMMESMSISLQPGLYELSFDLGNNYDGTSALNSMLVSVGSFLSVPVDSTLANPNTFTPMSFNFLVSSAISTTIIFDHSGGDAWGLIIDNVRLSSIPSPGALALLGMGGLISRRRRDDKDDLPQIQ